MEPAKPKFERKIVRHQKKYHRKKIDINSEQGRISTKQSDITEIVRNQKLLSIEQRDDLIPIGSLSKVPEKCLMEGRDRRESMPSDILSSLPYSAIVKLELPFNVEVYGGSGVLVGPSHVLTAAHNIYDVSLKEWTGPIRAIPAQDGSQAQFGSAYCVEMYKFTDCDLALLVLDMPIGRTTGWLGMTSYSDPENLRDKQLEITGYPGDKGKQDRMYAGRGKIEHIIGDRILYDIDTSKGQSGSPVWIKERNQNLVVAIHTDHDERWSLNAGVLLTKGRLERIKKWIEKTYWVKESPKGAIATMKSWLSRKFYKPKPYEIMTISGEQLEELAQKRRISIAKTCKKNFEIGGRDKILTIKAINPDLVNDETIGQLFKTVNDLTKKVRQGLWEGLTLNLSGCVKIHNSSVQGSLLQLGVSVLNFQSLDFNFEKCMGITDYFIDDLVKQFQPTHESIKQLTLNFNECVDIMNDSLCSLAIRIGTDLPYLQKLELRFSKSRFIGDRGLEELSSQLPKLKHLQTLCLDFDGCQQITDEGLNKLTAYFKNPAQSLEYVSLHFDWCQKISENAKRSLKRALQPIGDGYF